MTKNSTAGGSNNTSSNTNSRDAVGRADTSTTERDLSGAFKRSRTEEELQMYGIYKESIYYSFIGK